MFKRIKAWFNEVWDIFNDPYAWDDSNDPCPYKCKCKCKCEEDQSK